MGVGKAHPKLFTLHFSLKKSPFVMKSAFCSVAFGKILDAILKPLFLMLKNFNFLFILYFFFN